MKKIAIPFVLMVLASFCQTGCKKHSDTETPEPDKTATEKLEIFSGNKFANKDTLQAIYSQKNSDIVYSLHGPYNDEGIPQKPTSLVITRKDTCINMLLNDDLQVKMVFYTIKNVKDSTVFYLSYTDSSTLVTLYAFNWSNNTARRKAQCIIKTDDFTVSQSSLYRMARPETSAARLEDAPAELLNYAKAAGEILHNTITANKALIATSAFVGVDLLGPPGAIIGGLFGIYAALTKKPMSEQQVEVSQSDDYDYTDESETLHADPEDELQDDHAEQRLLAFGSAPQGTPTIVNTSWETSAQASIINLTLDISWNKTRNTILWASCNFDFSGISLTPDVNVYMGGHRYGEISSYLISGDHISITYFNDGLQKYWFNGELVNDKIVGTFYATEKFNKLDDHNQQTGIYVLYTTSAPVSIDIVN